MYTCHDIIFVRSISSSFTTKWHNAAKFAIIQVLMAIILVSICDIGRICMIAAFWGNGLVKEMLRLRMKILLGASSKEYLFYFNE